MSVAKFFVVCIACLFSQAYAFGVDVCFNDPSYGLTIIQNCININESCRTSNLTVQQQLSCRASALTTSMSGLSGSTSIIGGRSLVHSDSTYMMAQLIGFTPWQAYQIMIYSEATDQSEYTPFNQSGKQMLTNDQITACRSAWGPNMPTNCWIITPVMNGIYKFNYYTGGMLLHLHSRYSSNGLAPPSISFPTDYLSSSNQPYEVLLNNLRAWVFEQRGDACAAGITQVINSTSSPCASTSNTLQSPMYFFAPGYSQLAIPFVTQLGELIINAADTTTYATNSSFQNLINPHTVSMAKMGIFLHVLGDRNSHHMCSDNSYFYSLGNGNYTSSYSSVYCAQGSHFLWHAWEQGTTQTDANLGTAFQTMEPALSGVYDQLIDYANLLNIPVNPSLNKTQILSDLITVLQVYDPQTRLNNMVNLMESYGVLPLPGHGSVANYTIEQWLVAAGAPVTASKSKSKKIAVARK